MARQVLLKTAVEAEYFTLPTFDLERLWQLSNDFVENGRLQALEEDWYTLLEQHFYVSLLTCRDSVAKLMLQRIIDRFGLDSRRITKLRTAFVRATQEQEAFEKHVGNLGPIDYDARKIGFTDLKVKGKWQQYIEALVAYLRTNPVDAEAWSELAESYVVTGNYEDATQALDQVLLLVPFAYNVFARYGEIRQLQASLLQGGMRSSLEQMEDAIEHFARSVELCPSYIRGWCGVFVSATKTSQLGEYPDYVRLADKAKARITELIESKAGSEADLDAAKRILHG